MRHVQRNMLVSTVEVSTRYQGTVRCRDSAPVHRLMVVRAGRLGCVNTYTTNYRVRNYTGVSGTRVVPVQCGATSGGAQGSLLLGYARTVAIVKVTRAFVVVAPDLVRGRDVGGGEIL